MKRHIIILMLCLVCLGASAQQNKFNPQRFQAALEQFITREAKLTQKEAADFFPIYKELQAKQRALFQQAGRARWRKPATEAECRSAIEKQDNVDIQIKKLQKQYHQKFLKVISASKLYDVIKAEDQFHRQSIRKFTERMNSQRQRNHQSQPHR